jgi:hypothetical protein
MRWLKSIAVVMAILAFIGASVKDAMAQGTGRLELKLEPVVLDSKVKRLAMKIIDDVGEYLITQRPPCCPDPVCCHPPNDPRVFGIFIPSQGSAVVLEEAYIEIYSGKTKKLLISTVAKCNGCGSGVSLKPGDKATGYLLTLDQKAAEATEQHFVKGNFIKVHLRTKDSKGTPDLIYIVNAGSGSQ